MVGGALLAGAGGGAAVTIMINAVDKASGVFSKVNKNMLAIGAGATIAGAAILGVANIAVQGASDIQESVNAVNVTYGENSKAVLKMGEDSAKSFGMSRAQYNSSAVQFSAFANIVVKDGENVANVVKTMTGRTADFASVMNIDLARAQTLMMSGLAGETEGLRRFGIDVSAVTVQNYAYANGIANVGDKLTEQQKVQARYGTIMEQTNKVQGDFINTSDSLANRQRILKATTTDLVAELGESLLPAFEAVIGVVQKALEWFSGLSDGTKKFIVITTALTGALLLVVGPILMIIAILPVLAAGLGMVATGLTAVAIAGLPVWVVALLIAAALAALIFVGYLLVKHWDKIKIAAGKLGVFMKNVFISIANVVLSVWNRIIDIIESSINRVLKAINRIISAYNSVSRVIPGLRKIGKIDLLDLGRFKGEMLQRAEFIAPELSDTPAQSVTNVNIENINGISGSDIADSLQAELNKKVTVG